MIFYTSLSANLPLFWDRKLFVLVEAELGSDGPTFPRRAAERFDGNYRGSCSGPGTLLD